MRPFFVRPLFLTLLLLSGSISTSAQLAADVIRQTEAEAYGQIMRGDIWEGTTALVDLLRAVPGDDPAYADSMVGPAQLLGFSIAFLLNWDQRRALQDDYLKPDVYVTDRMLVAGVKVAADLGRDKFLQSYAEFRELVKGDHEAVRVAALCFLADPYYFKDYPELQQNTAQLFLRYGERAIARNLLRQTLCNTIGDRLKRPRPGKTIFADIIYSGGRAEPICAVDPVIAQTTAGLPSYDLLGVGAVGPKLWGSLAKEDPNDEVRYLSLRLLASTDDQPDALALARTAAREAAAREEDTRDAALARGMALEYARGDFDFEEMGTWAARLLKQGQLPGEPERCLYEWEIRALQHAAETYARYGFHREAQGLYQALAAKYPNSEMADKCRANIEEMQKDPLAYSLDLVQREARHRFRRYEFDESAAFYREVAAHTPHASLAAACESEAARFDARAVDSNK